MLISLGCDLLNGKIKSTLKGTSYQYAMFMHKQIHSISQVLYKLRIPILLTPVLANHIINVYYFLIVGLTGTGKKYERRSRGW